MTSIRPSAALLVEGSQDLHAPGGRRGPPGTAQPRLDAGPSRESGGLGPQQLGHADAGLGSPTDERRVHLVVHVTDLHGLGH